MPDKVEVYTDAKGEHRWHRKAGNGEIVSESSEGYHSRTYAVEQAGELNPDVPVVEVVEEPAEQPDASASSPPSSDG